MAGTAHAGLITQLTITDDSGQIWDTVPGNGLWLAGVGADLNPGTPLLNDGDGSISVAAGTYYIYMSSETVAPYWILSIVEDGLTRTATFESAPDQYTGTPTLTRVLGDTGLSLSGVASSTLELDKVNGSEGAGADVSFDAVLRVDIVAGSGGGGTVPEPGAVVLMLSGLAALVGVKRRRENRAEQ